MTLDETIALLSESARENGVPPDVTAKLIADLRKAQKEEADDRKRTSAKRAKHQFVVLLTRPEEGAKADAARLGFVLQLEESVSPAVAYDRVIAAANAFNSSRKGRRVPVKTVGETLENVPARYYKTANPTEVTRVKTRVAVAALTIRSNELPKESHS